MVLSVTVDGLTTTAINTTSSAAATPDTYMTYTLSGTPATYSTHGLVIKNKRKVFRK